MTIVFLIWKILAMIASAQFIAVFALYKPFLKRKEFEIWRFLSKDRAFTYEDAIKHWSFPLILFDHLRFLEEEGFLIAQCDPVHKRVPCYFLAPKGEAYQHMLVEMHVFPLLRKCDNDFAISGSMMESSLHGDCDHPTFDYICDDLGEIAVPALIAALSRKIMICRPTFAVSCLQKLAPISLPDEARFSLTVSAECYFAWAREQGIEF